MLQMSSAVANLTSLLSNAQGNGLSPRRESWTTSERRNSNVRHRPKEDSTKRGQSTEAVEYIVDVPDVDEMRKYPWE